MNRTLSSTVLGVVILAVGACGGDPDPAAAPPPPSAEAPVVLPEDTQVIDVPVTKPADPQPVDPKDLPATARAVGQMPGLSADERICANYAIKTTLDRDPSIAQTNGKVASVLGNSVVACTPPDKLATLVGEGIGGEGRPLSAEQRACMERTVAADPQGTARFLSALLTMNVATVIEASKRYDEACQVAVAPT